MSGVKMGNADSRRERKKQETHQRLLESAWHLFQEKEYDQTTVEDITEVADVAKGTLFNYFETKEALMDEIALWRIDLLGHHVLAGKSVPENAVARIKLMMRAMADEFSPERELTHHLFVARLSAPVRHESAHRLGSLMHELVSQGQARREIRDDVDAGLIARLLMTCFFHVFVRRHHVEARCAPSQARDEESRPEDPLVLEEKLIQSVDALMDGLGGTVWQVATARAVATSTGMAPAAEPSGVGSAWPGGETRGIRDTRSGRS
jgi:AcrR family transcriptional regulator